MLAVGDEGALSGLKTGDTKIVDLAGRTLLPGLIDPHFHTILASLIFELLNDVGYAKYPTREKLVAHLKEVAASAPKGQWVVGSNFDNLLQGGDFTRGELDAISTDYPIFVWYTNGHDACVNSAALRVAGISEDVGELPGGGHFGRGPDGKLDGMVYEESAMLKFAVHGDQGRTRRRWLRGAAIDKMPKVEVHVVQSPEAPTASAGVAPVGQRRYRADSPAGAAESWRTASGDDQPCRPDPIKTNSP